MLRQSHILQLATIALLGVGVVMVASAASNVAERPTGILSALYNRHTLYALIAVSVMLLASRINVRQLYRARGPLNPLWLMVAASLVTVALTLVPGFGREVKGAVRWLAIGPPSWGLSFQPSELVKWTMILALAGWCARRHAVMHRFWFGPAPALALLALAAGLIVIEDLGTAVLIAGVGVLMLVAGGARLWQLAMLAPPAIAAVVAAILHSPYRLHRLTAFLDPWAHADSAGYHPLQSMLAFAHGGLTGVGLGEGVQKLGYVPEDTTDFIFTIIAEELGLAGAALVIALYLTLLWTGLGVLRQCQDTFGRLVALGILLTLGVQATLNLAVVTATVPTKGIALPLVSAGGTGWILTALSLGLLAALDNANHDDSPIDPEPHPTPQTHHPPRPS